MNAVATPPQPYPYLFSLERNIFTQQYLFNSMPSVRSFLKAQSEYKLCTGVCMLPQPGKPSPNGEDAYFITEDGCTIGVADGVGGWNQLGVDPSLYSNSLMQHAKEAAKIGVSIPLQILSIAYENSHPITGSSTACILALNDNELQSANLGDSGFMVIRGNRIIHKTKEQQHSFNFPYQLGTGSTDRPEHATVANITIEEGDIVVLGSDGLWDNLYDDQILEIVNSEECKIQMDPTRIATIIAAKAHEVADSPTVDSPFAVNAKKNNITFSGGKMDDITVLVSRVVFSGKEQEEQLLNSTPSLAAIGNERRMRK